MLDRKKGRMIKLNGPIRMKNSLDKKEIKGMGAQMKNLSLGSGVKALKFMI